MTFASRGKHSWDSAVFTLIKHIVSTVVDAVWTSHWTTWNGDSVPLISSLRVWHHDFLLYNFFRLKKKILTSEKHTSHLSLIASGKRLIILGPNRNVTLCISSICSHFMLQYSEKLHFKFLFTINHSYNNGNKYKKITLSIYLLKLSLLTTVLMIFIFWVKEIHLLCILFLDSFIKHTVFPNPWFDIFSFHRPAVIVYIPFGEGYSFTKSLWRV